MPAETLTKDQHPTSQTRRIAALDKRPGLPASRRRFWRKRTVRRWLLAWVGAPVLAILNGAVREFAYKDQVGESAANQISVAPLITLLGLYLPYLFSGAVFVEVIFAWFIVDCPVVWTSE